MTIFEMMILIVGGIVVFGILALSAYQNECRIEEERKIRELLLESEKEGL